MINSLFSTDGQLSKNIKGFSPRPAQKEMAQLIAQAIDKQTNTVIEAQTGTGKTFAYLVPTLLSKKKTIISTGSKNLQEQLFGRDLPIIKKALNYKGKVSLLKGRANYLCIERMHSNLYEANQVSGKEQFVQLTQIRDWASQTKTGDLGACTFIPEDSPLMSHITSTNDNCLGKNCPSYTDCFVLKARNRALNADIIVVNHHLFMADVALKETGFGELLPASSLFIFDEAHQLPDIGSKYFSQTISSRQIEHLAKDIDMAYQIDMPESRQLSKIADGLRQRNQLLHQALIPIKSKNWQEALTHTSCLSVLSAFENHLEFSLEVLGKLAGNSKLLDAAFERLHQIKLKWDALRQVDNTECSYWFELSAHQFSLHITPLSIADKFSQTIKELKGTWVFTSATLAVDGQFEHFKQQLGLTKTQDLLLPSPFDYQAQSLLCIPSYLPEPNHPQLAHILADKLAPLIEKNQGRCFFLCTSHFMMKALGALFREKLTIPVLLQGETSKQQTLSQFLTLGNALLVATGAFWEGVDVRGEALNCVIIDKLPFTAPDDPLLKARVEHCQLLGGDPFNDIQIPTAVIALKQGVGRLIRDTSDKGAIIICDNRLLTRHYGKIFLSSLPDMPRTRDLTRVETFLQSIATQE